MPDEEQGKNGDAKRTIQINIAAYRALIEKKSELERAHDRVYSLAEVLDSALGLA